MTHAPPTSRRRSRAGLTFVEVIVCVGIVAGAAVLVFGSIGFLENVAQHNRDRLNGTEVAHRVILQWIDDFKSFRGQEHRVQQGGAMYQFDVWEEVLVSEDGLDDSDTKSARQHRHAVKADSVSIDDRMKAQIHQITVEVFAQLPDGSRSARPVATLVRSYTPMLGLGGRGMAYVVDLMEQASGIRVIN